MNKIGIIKFTIYLDISRFFYFINSANDFLQFHSSISILGQFIFAPARHDISSLYLHVTVLLPIIPNSISAFAFVFHIYHDSDRSSVIISTRQQHRKTVELNEQFYVLLIWYYMLIINHKTCNLHNSLAINTLKRNECRMHNVLYASLCSSALSWKWLQFACVCD